MKKFVGSLFGITVIAFAALFFAGCPHDGGGGGNGGGETTESGTFIKFKNLDLYPVEVHTASDRSGSPLASVPAQGESAAFAWNAGEAGFYLKYAVSVGGVSFPYIPLSAAGYLYARVDAGKTRTITIPSLIEALSSAELNQTFTSDVYVNIQNDSNFSMQFHKGSSILKPENSQYSTVMDGESAVYKISAGPVSDYTFKRNGVTDVSFPAGLASFEAGKMYRFVFNGSQMTQNPAQPLSLSVAAGYEEKAAAEPSLDVPVPSSLAAAALSESEIRLTWNIAGSGNYTYYLFKSPSSTGEYTLAGISQETSFVSGGLDSRTTYYYKTRAFLNGKYSAYSSSASARTLLAAPRGVTAETLSLSSIKVSWNAVSGASSYAVERSGSEAGPYAQVTSASGTTYTDSGLNTNAVYYYRVRASSGGEFSAYSNIAFAATTDLQAPTGLAAAAASSTKINLSWNAVSGASSYYVYRSAAANGTYTEITSVTGTSYSNTGLQSGTTYYYKVRSYYNGAYSNYSSAVSAATPVDAPAGVTAQALSPSEIRLTWNAVTTGAERYYLYTAANSSGPWTELAYVSATSYTHSGLTGGTAYYYKVRAYRNGVYSADSASVNAATALDAPVISSVASGGAGALVVTWSAVTNAAGYDLYYSTTTTAPSSANKTSVTSPYTLTGLSAGTTYYIWVKAKNAVAASALSASASRITMPAAPTGVTAQAQSASSIRVSWTAVTGASGYDVYYHTANDSSAAAKVSGAANPYTISGLSSETTYYVWVKAKNSSGESAYSAVVSAIPPVAGLFVGDNLAYDSGVASPFSIAHALAWLKTNAQADTAYTIVINADETLAPQTLSQANLNNKSGVSITLWGYGSERTVQLASNGSLFTVESGVTLTLDENITLTGLTSNTAALVYVNAGTLNMKERAKVKGNTNTSSSGGGVYVTGTGVNSRGTFTMSGGEISSNTAFSSGGGVLVGSGGTFTMNGGEISGNTIGAGMGGGVYVAGTFTMTGGEISGNATNGDYGGGGVGVAGTFTMAGGEISGNTGNTASAHGGGVYVMYGTFTMAGGEISGNTTGSYGGGVDLQVGTFTMSGGEISSNTAYYGGGVYVSSSGGTFKKQPASGSSTSGVIYGYTADDAKSNKVVSSSGVVQSGRGHAVRSTSVKSRETTVVETESLDSTVDGAAGGWVE